MNPNAAGGGGCCRILVTGVPKTVTAEELSCLFLRVGQVETCMLGPTKGSAFITFLSPMAAEMVLEYKAWMIHGSPLVTQLHSCQLNYELKPSLRCDIQHKYGMVREDSFWKNLPYDNSCIKKNKKKHPNTFKMEGVTNVPNNDVNRHRKKTTRAVKTRKRKTYGSPVVHMISYETIPFGLPPNDVKTTQGENKSHGNVGSDYQTNQQNDVIEIHVYHRILHIFNIQKSGLTLAKLQTKIEEICKVPISLQCLQQSGHVLHEENLQDLPNLANVFLSVKGKGGGRNKKDKAASQERGTPKGHRSKEGRKRKSQDDSGVRDKKVVKSGHDMNLFEENNPPIENDNPLPSTSLAAPRRNSESIADASNVPDVKKIRSVRGTIDQLQSCKEAVATIAELLSEHVKPTTQKKRGKNFQADAGAWLDLEQITKLIDETLRDLENCDTSVAFLGFNGIGKSFILNHLMRVTATNGDLYKFKKVKLKSYQERKKTKTCTEDEHNYLDQNIEEQRLKAVLDVIYEEEDKIDEYETYKDNVKYMDDEFKGYYLKKYKTNDDESLEMLKKYSEGTRLKTKFQPYLLPSGDSMEATTNSIVHVRYGERVQMSVTYLTKEEIQNCCDELTVRCEEKSLGHYSEMSSGEQQLVTKCDALTKHSLKFIEGYDYREKHGHHQKWPKKTGSIELDDAVIEKVCHCDQKRMVEIYAGNGDDFQEDRLFIMHKLNELMGHIENQEPITLDKNKKLRYTIKKIIVYFPSDLLKGSLELLDIPGCEKEDPFSTCLIRDALDSVSFLAVISEKTFKNGPEEIRLAIKESNFIDRMINKPDTHNICFITYSEKTQSASYEELREFEGKKEKCLRLKEDEKKYFRDKYLSPKLETNPRKLEEIMEKCVHTLAIWPTYFTSVLLRNNGEFEADTSRHLKFTSVFELLRLLETNSLKICSDKIRPVKENMVELYEKLPSLKNFRGVSPDIKKWSQDKRKGDNANHIEEFENNEIEKAKKKKVPTATLR